MRWCGVVLLGAFVVGCAAEPRPEAAGLAGLRCQVGGERVAADPVTGCGPKYPVPPAHEACPAPVLIRDAENHPLPGVTLPRRQAGGGAPVYPDAYAGSGRVGAAAARCVVTVSGHLCGCRLIDTAAPDYFGQSFLGWLHSDKVRMTPATKDGQAVAAAYEVRVSFEERTYSPP